LIQNSLQKAHNKSTLIPTGKSQFEKDKNAPVAYTILEIKIENNSSKAYMF